jgi:hypothetical protein
MMTTALQIYRPSLWKAALSNGLFPVAAVSALLEMMTTGGSVLAVMRGPTMCAQPVTR